MEARPEPLGIVAGRGGLPGAVAAEVMAAGRPVVQFALVGMAEPIPGAIHVPFTPYKIGQLTTGAARHGVRDLVLAGKVDRPNPLKVGVDLGTLRFARLLLSARQGGDDRVTRRVSRALETLGFHVVSVAEVAPALIARPGVLGRHAPSAGAKADIAAGLAVVRGIGALDIGQAAVVHRERAVAIEAAEGTDAMIARAGLLGARGGVLVKGAKPGQALRDDMPTIGLATIEAAIAAGLSAVAVVAGEVILVEVERMVARADEGGLALVGVEAPR